MMCINALANLLWSIVVLREICSFPSYSSLSGLRVLCVVALVTGVVSTSLDALWDVWQRIILVHDLRWDCYWEDVRVWLLIVRDLLHVLLAISKLGVSAGYFSLWIPLFKEHLIADHLSLATLWAEIVLHSTSIALALETIVSNQVFGGVGELFHLELHPVLVFGLHRVQRIS